ncbi:MAG TPA: cytidylate kinase-like family protein [Candidatus Xenobia bacterium]|jgi:cytidylate kinase
MSRQLGAGQTSVAPAVAAALGWKVVDHEILDRQVQDLGTTLPYVTHHDERAPGLMASWSHPQEATRYFQSLEKIMGEYADGGNVILVGRGANFFLKFFDALHVRLVADMAYRIKRVMEVRWVNAGPAKDIIAQSDQDRAAFFRYFFQTEWSDPLNFHVVLNTSRLGIEAVTAAIVSVARQRWSDA